MVQYLTVCGLYVCTYFFLRCKQHEIPIQQRKPNCRWSSARFARAKTARGQSVDGKANAVDERPSRKREAVAERDE
jgi:hypothetical protein